VKREAQDRLSASDRSYEIRFTRHVLSGDFTVTIMNQAPNRRPKGWFIQTTPLEASIGAEAK
jgi:hypothetical protein